MNAFEKIRLIRQLNKLTQTEFGESLGISKATVSNLEKGKVPIPPYFVLLLKHIYNVDPKWLQDDAQSELDKRFYDKDQEVEDFEFKALCDKMHALKDPYDVIAKNTVEQLYNAQKKQESER